MSRAKNTPPTETAETDEPITTIEKNEDGTDKNAKPTNKGEAQVEDGYVRLEIPWSLSLNYSLAYSNSGEFDYERLSAAVIDDFRKGRIGKIFLD